MKAPIVTLLLALAAVVVRAQPQPGTDKFVPTLGQLGAGWVSNSIVALVDPLSSPSEVGSEGSGMLDIARRMVKTHEREAFAAVQYVYGSSNVWVWVWINRYRSKDEMPSDWGRDKLTKMKLESLPRVGDEVRFCQRDGMHNDFSFRRGNYLICVEGMSAPVEKLRQLAEVLDANLVRAQKEAASGTSEPRPEK
jgi:hypothetical protein